MRLSRGLADLRPDPKGAAVTIGNFDGVHLGHRAVLLALRASAATVGGPATVVCFEPTPREFFAPAATPARLTRFAEKHALLAAAGCDHLVVLRFDAELAALDAEAFVRCVLVEGLGAARVVIGDDFRFGRNRSGDLARMTKLGARHGFAVDRAPGFELDGARVSSTAVRARIAAGELDAAARLLGRRYAIGGRVVYGDRLGRRLGFPTVNLPLRRRVSPLHGVFLVRVAGAGPVPRWGAASVGTRPTVGGSKARCEVHLLDFDGDLYGRRLQVEFHARLRDEWRFDSLDALRVQIGRDVEQARALAKIAEVD